MLRLINANDITSMTDNTATPADETLDEELLYCRQFILGPGFINIMPGWQYIEIDSRLKLSMHPEVEVERIVCAEKTLVAIGSIFDSLAPAKSNRDILAELIVKADNIEALTKATGHLGGRWLLIAKFEENRYLFNDALGLRQVFYTESDITGALWLVSQPGLAEKFLHLDLDKSAVEFMDSLQFRKRDQPYWPAAATAFKGLKHLLPNHYLDLNSGKKFRFWPYAPIGAMTSEAAAEFLEYRMTNIVQAAANRYPLAIGITAGIDSRVVTALAKDISREIDFVTVRQRKMPDDDPDINIPDQLADIHGLHRVVVKANPSMSANFAKLFKDNVFMATDIYGPDAEAIMNKLHRKKAVITGIGGEMAKCILRRMFPKISYNGPLNASDLAVMQGFTDNTFAIAHFNAWLDDVHNRYDIKLIDLFYWEHSHGNWVAMTQMQFDIAWREIITPFNCRDVLQAILAVDEKNRVAPGYLLYRKIISRSWPELLDLPVNPRKKTKFGLRKVQSFMTRKLKSICRW